MSTSFSRSPNLENRARKILVLSPRQLAEPGKVAGNRLIPRNSLKRYTMFVTSKRTHCPSFFSLFRPRLFAVIRRVCTRASRLLIFRCVRKTATFPADTPGGLSRFLCSISKYRLLPWPFFFASSLSPFLLFHHSLVVFRNEDVWEVTFDRVSITLNLKRG